MTTAGRPVAPGRQPVPSSSSHYLRRSSPLWLLPLLLLVGGCDDPRPPVAPPAESAPAPVAASSAGAAARPMLIWFTRDYCLPCQIMKPWVQQLRREQSQRVDVVVVNLDREKNRRFGLHFAITSVPTQIFISKAGLIEARAEGVATGEEMTATIRRLGWIP